MRMADTITTIKTAAEAHAAPVSGIAPAEIADAAANPQSFSVEGLSQTNRSISDLIAADKYLRKRAMAGRRRHPLSGMVSHLIPPGTCDR